MMYYAVTQDLVKDGITLEMMTPHVEYMHQLMEQGVVVISGPFSDELRGGMFVLEVKSENEAKELADNDPAVISGILRNNIRLYDLKFLKK